MIVLNIKSKWWRIASYTFIGWALGSMVGDAWTRDYFGLFVHALIGAVWTDVLFKTIKIEKLEAKIAAEYQAKLVKKEEEPK